MKKYLYLVLSMALSFNTAFAEELVLEEIQFSSDESKPHKPILSFDDTPSSHSREQQSLDDLYTQIDAQKQNLKEFTEQMELLQHQLKLVEEKLEKTNQDIVFRLSELENKEAPSPVILDKKSDKERYEYAYSLLNNKKYSEAQKEFLSFLKDFPKSDLLPNATYWLGETYYVQGLYEQAVGQFADVFTKYRASNKAPDALLKMGLSMASLNKKTESCTAFMALPNEYPKATEELKKRAKEEAQKNKCS